MKFGVILTINFLAVHGVRRRLDDDQDHHRAGNLHKFFKVQKGKWGTTNPVQYLLPLLVVLDTPCNFWAGSVLQKNYTSNGFFNSAKKETQPNTYAQFAIFRGQILLRMSLLREREKVRLLTKKYELFGFIYSRDKMFCFY